MLGIKSFFRDAKWCFSASWGPKGLTKRTKQALVQCWIMFSDCDPRLSIAEMTTRLLAAAGIIWTCVNETITTAVIGRCAVVTSCRKLRNRGIPTLPHQVWQSTCTRRWVDVVHLTLRLVVSRNVMWQISPFHTRASLPSRHKTLSQCWFRVGTPSTTLEQR